MLHSEFLLNQRPAVADAHAARAWLRELPLSDARVAHHALEALLDGFDDNALSLRKRLDILETIRTQRVEVDAQYAQRYAGKPVPLAQAERVACTHALSLWQKLEGCYWDCARAAAAGDGTVQRHLALCLARAANVQVRVCGWGVSSGVRALAVAWHVAAALDADSSGWLGGCAPGRRWTAAPRSHWRCTRRRRANTECSTPPCPTVCIRNTR